MKKEDKEVIQALKEQEIIVALCCCGTKKTKSTHKNGAMFDAC